MKISHVLFATLAAFVLIGGCKKDEDDPASPAPAQPTVNPLLQVFADNLQDAAQDFTVNASAGGSVFGADGTAFFLQANAFRHANGTMVTGTVQIELVEALTVGDMIWLNKQTLGNDNGQLKALVSGGQFFLKATQGGEELDLAPGTMYVTVPAPNGVDPNMELFSGSVEADGTITWDPFANTGAIGADSSGYGFPNDSLGWVNCDYYMGGGTQTVVQVTCPTGHTEDNTIMWLVFPDQNSVTTTHYSSGSIFSTGAYYTLPVGMNLKIVAIANINGVITSSITTSVVSAGMNPTITFSPTTLAQFEVDVNAL